VRESVRGPPSSSPGVHRVADVNYDNARILGCRDLTTFKDSDPQISRLTTMDNGYRVYNLGPVGDYPYKELFVTDFPEGGVNSLY